MDITIDQVVNCPTLPSLPLVAMEVLELTRDPNVDLAVLAELVQKDQALAAKVLKTINSSYYGLSQPCTTIARAMSFLGVNSVKSLVLGFSLIDTTRKGDGFDFIEYWRRCVYAGAAARRIGAAVGSLDAEEAFTAALLQDIGMLAMNAKAPSAYADVVTKTRGHHGRLGDLERAAFGFTHAEAGAALCEKWKLPGHIVLPVLHHHAAPVEKSKPHHQLINTVGLANRMAIALTGSDRDEVKRVHRIAQEAFGLVRADVDELISAVSTDGAELSSLLQVDVGPQPDVATLLADAEDAIIAHRASVEREVADLQAQNTQLAEQALTDELTGVGNRKRYEDELAARYEQALAFRGCLGVIMVDGDRFKAVNDNHGHPVGDVVIQELARRTSAAAGDEGIVCRYGGEEFAVLLPGAGRKRTAEVAEAIRIAIGATPFDVRAAGAEIAELPITASLGAAALEPESTNVFTKPGILVQAADRALYAAKDGGRNCVRIFTPERRVSPAA